MALTFPTPTTVGETHSEAGRTWSWNGTAWQVVSGYAAASHTHPLSQLEQSSATNGQVATWNGTAWVPATPTSGGVTSYNQLTDKPTLGTAAATASTDYATAAQGAKADSALQLGAAISAISGLQTALDGKQASGSYAPASGISPTAITGTAVVTNDPRLSDSRTPTSHTHAAGDITSGTLADARLSANVVLTTDARLTNSRTPTSHKSTHSTGGADALAPADIGAVTNGGGASTISVMTQAAYTALPVKDNNTIYILT